MSLSLSLARATLLKSHEFLIEDGVANPRSEMETHGSSFPQSKRVGSARLPQTLDV